MTVALAICGSNLAGTTAYSCALAIDGDVVESSTPVGDRGDLGVLVAELCTRGGVRPHQLQELRADLGPGSYTGLRVALTFARTLATLDGLRIWGIDSLALLAAAAPADCTRSMPMVDARRDRWHCGWFTRTDAATLVQSRASSALTIGEVLAAHQPGDAIVAVPGQAARVTALLAGLVPQPRIVAATPMTAAILFDTRMPLVALTAEQLQPRYLMGSYADS